MCALNKKTKKKKKKKQASVSFWLKILFCILVAEYWVTQPRAAPPASPGTALHVLDCNLLALYKYFPSLRHSWNSGLGFCQVYLRGSHKHVTCCVPKTLEPELPWVPNPRLQLKSVKTFSFSSGCTSSCVIYDLSLLTIVSIPCSASSWQKPYKPKQNTTMTHPCLPPTLHGIWVGPPWDQRFRSCWDFSPLCQGI